MTTYIKRENLIVHEMDDEILLYDPQIDRTHRLNPTAAMIWRLCDGSKTPEEMARSLMEHYEVEFDAAIKDTQSVVQQFLHERIILEHTPPS